jgi:hypothetical protein
MGLIKELIVHHSDSDFGNAILIDKWHKNRKPPFKMIGYHWVILNGRSHSEVSSRGFPFMNGSIETGRPVNDDLLMDEDEQGAHVYGYNKDTLAVCLIGKRLFTIEQMMSLKRIVDDLGRIGMQLSVKGHREVDMPGNETECPVIDMDYVRAFLSMNHSDGLSYLFNGEISKYIRLDLGVSRFTNG